VIFRKTLAAELRLAGRQVLPQAGATADAADGARSAWPKAEDQPSLGAAPDLPLPAARPDDRSAKPRVGSRHYLQICVWLSPEDRAQLEGWLADRNTPQKLVWCRELPHRNLHPSCICGY
jgi:hypothetical protein